MTNPTTASGGKGDDDEDDDAPACATDASANDAPTTNLDSAKNRMHPQDGRTTTRR
jgi:hypothetical protein